MISQRIDFGLLFAEVVSVEGTTDTYDLEFISDFSYFKPTFSHFLDSLWGLSGNKVI